jgi:prepilin-type N-terminal cleavage/methylation domain-containing protein
MTTCDRNRGFTLVELVVVLGVLGILIGAAAPLANAALDANRRQEAQSELAAIGEALEAYYFERAAFPPSLAEAGFLGVHLQPRVGTTAIADPFAAANAAYRYRIDTVANTATVHAIGENRRDNAGAGDDLVLVVHGAAPAMRRTAQKLRLIVERLADHIEAGGVVTGNWTTVRTNLGLGNEYQNDGWGRSFGWDATTYTLRSGGPDRTLGTADDITL